MHGLNSITEAIDKLVKFCTSCNEPIEIP